MVQRKIICNCATKAGCAFVFLRSRRCFFPSSWNDGTNGFIVETVTDKIKGSLWWRGTVIETGKTRVNHSVSEFCDTQLANFLFIFFTQSENNKTSLIINSNGCFTLLLLYIWNWAFYFQTGILTVLSHTLNNIFLRWPSPRRRPTSAVSTCNSLHIAKLKLC